MSDEHPVFRALSPGLGDWREAVKLIKAGDVSPDASDQEGVPVIIHAARAGLWEAFEALVIAGADVAATDTDGITAFHYVIAGIVRPNWKYWSQRQIRDCKKMAAMFAERRMLGTNAQAIFALVANKLPPFRALLDHGLDPNTRVEDPYRVLLQCNQKKLVEALLADRNRRAAGQAFTAPPTLLMWAAALDRPKFVELLAAHGADQSARDDLRYSAADYAEIYRASKLPGALE